MFASADAHYEERLLRQTNANAVRQQLASAAAPSTTTLALALASRP